MAARHGRKTESPALPNTRLQRHHLPVVVGWLLRSQRLLGADPAVRPLAQFATAAARLPGEPALSPSRMSRWETGIHPVPHSVFTRYEHLIGLPYGALAAPVDLVHRHFADKLRLPLSVDRRLPDLDRATHARLADVVDRVHTGSAVTGADWDFFTAFLTETPHLVLPRPDSAAELARRLLSETLIADGLAWQLRFEALNRMLAHPLFAEDATAACIAVVDDPHHPAVSEAINLLDGSVDPSANAFLLTALADPGRGEVFDGALMAAVRRSRVGAFGAEEGAVVYALLSELAQDASVDLVTRRLGLRVLAHLRAHPRTRHGVPADQAVVAQARLSLPDDVHEAGLSLVEDLQTHALDTLRVRSARFDDQTLPTLLRAAILDPVPDQRLYLAMLLNASPYRDAVASRAAHWLLQPPHPHLRRNLLTLARVLGDGRVAGSFVSLATDQDVDMNLRVSALRALGHLRLPSRSEAWSQAEGTVATAGGMRSTHDALAGALAYALGVADHAEALARLRDRLPANQRGHADWWLAQPSVVRAPGSAAP